MSLFEEDFDADYDIENVDGVEFGDIFYLNYYGINVFFYVCGTDHHRVRIFELAKKHITVNGIKAEAIAPKLSPTTSPKVVLSNNCWTKSNFWVDTNSDGQIYIPVNDGPLVYKAISLGVEYPLTGEYRAYPLKKEKENGILNYYWELPKRTNHKNKNILKINA